MPWKARIQSHMLSGKSQDWLLAKIETVNKMGWFIDELEYQQTVKMVNDYFIQQSI